MFQSARSRTIGAAAALLISWSAVYWLFSLLPLKHDIFFRIGFISAAVCALGGLAFFWGLLLSHIARWLNWSPRKCHVAGFSVLIPLSILYFAIPQAHFALAFDWAATLWWVTGYICGKLAHPELTDDDAYAPEPPLTLFPK